MRLQKFIEPYSVKEYFKRKHTSTILKSYQTLILSERLDDLLNMNQPISKLALRDSIVQQLFSLCFQPLAFGLRALNNLIKFITGLLTIPFMLGEKQLTKHCQYTFLNLHEVFLHSLVAATAPVFFAIHMCIYLPSRLFANVMTHFQQNSYSPVQAGAHQNTMITHKPPTTTVSPQNTDSDLSKGPEQENLTLLTM